MRIVVLGKSGQVASSLIDTGVAGHNIVALGRRDLDLSTTSQIVPAISEYRPEVIINAAAYTAVDKAEDDPIAAAELNQNAVRRIGEAAQSLDIPVIHISTDYVFDGSGQRAWAPYDPTNPLSIYGKTKRDGELALSSSCDRYAIMRTSWVYSAYGNNFVKTMLKLGKDRSSLNIVADQIGGPTSAEDIAAAAIVMAQSLARKTVGSGIWHFSGQADCSWAEFATEIFDQAGLECQVDPITTTDYPTPAKRPLNSRLDCTTTLQDFGIERPDWKRSLRKVLTELGESQ